MPQTESSVVGDISEKVVNSVKSEDEKQTKIASRFPWRPFLLSLTRLVTYVVFYYQGASQLVIRRDGSVTTKQLIKKRYNYLKYSHNNSMMPVLTMSLAIDPTLAMFSVISALCLFIATIAAYKQQKKGNCVAEEDREKCKVNRSCYFSIIIIILTLIGLLFAANDLICGISGALNHIQMLLINVGPQEALSFLLATSIFTGLQMYCWLGGLDFQKELFSL